MQTLDSTPYVISQMPEGQAPVAWTQAYASMEQNPNQYVMNVIKPDHNARGRVMEQPAQSQSQSGGNLLPTSNPASVITATYNPTYNRCLPKILSDLDCEMKIKQVLKCIENILLDGSDLDPQQSYKLPDRSSSPQLVPKKKIKVKEDEDMTMIAANTMGANNAPANTPKVGLNKSPVRINVKVEQSETEKAQRAANAAMYQDQGAHQVPSASPRAQCYDFSSANRAQQAAPNTSFSKPPAQQRAFSFEPYAYSNPNPASNTQYAQSFLQHPQVTHQQHSSLLMQQQQQHLQAVQQHLQAQQHLLNTVNSVGAMHPLLHPSTQHHMQYSLPQANSHIQGSQPTHSQTHDGQASTPSQQSQIQENSSFTPVQMDEFPFPVFSSTILEEVNQFKSAAREENKKSGEGDEQVFFFGGSPTNGAMWNATQLQTEAGQQAYPEGSLQDQLRQAGLSTSALLQQTSLPLLFQMPQLSGLEEDDKWILSLLNIDGPQHENAANSAPNF